MKEYKENGATHMMDVRGIHEAREILVERGIHFTRVYHHPIVSRRYYGAGRDEVEDGLHYYFSDDDGNIVAYWTRIMNHLSINDGAKTMVGKPWMERSVPFHIAPNPCLKEKHII
jgi:hypothetical protein